MSKKKYNDRRAVGPLKIDSLLPEVTKDTFKKRGFAEGKIITDWAEIVGTELAKYSAPAKLYFPKGKRNEGTLHINIFGSLASELQHMEPLIIEKIATYIGYKAVAKIKLHHKNRENPQPPEEKKEITEKRMKNAPKAVSDINDKNLRSALEGLGSYVLARDNKDKE